MKAKNIQLENLTITKCWGDGINLNNSTGSAGSDNENVFINNCICDNNRRQGMSIESVKNMLVQNSKFIKGLKYSVRDTCKKHHPTERTRYLHSLKKACNRMQWMLLAFRI